MRNLFIVCTLILLSACASEQKKYGVPMRVWDILTEDQKAQVAHDYQVAKHKQVEEMRASLPQTQQEKIIYPHKVDNRKPWLSKTFEWGKGKGSDNKK